MAQAVEFRILGKEGCTVAMIPVYQKSHGCETTGARVGGDAQLLFTKRGETLGGDGRRKSQDLRKVHGRDSRRFRDEGATVVVIEFGDIIGGLC